MDNIKRISEIPRNKFVEYFDIALSVSKSPSLEIRRLGDALVRQIFETENPKEIYQKVEEVFIKNNLPLVGKVMRIFDILNPEDKLDSILLNEKLSPVLRNYPSDLRRRDIIYRDLIKIHIESGNNSLREYLKVMKDGSELSDKAINGLELTDREIKKLANFIKKTQTLYDNSLLGKTENNSALNPTEIRQAVDKVYQDLKVRPGQTIDERVSEMFLYPIGARNIGQALEQMAESKIKAKERRRQIRDKFKNGYYLEEGDLVKGIIQIDRFDSGKGYQILDNILNNGSVAVEFLGSDATHDATPLDTDCIKVIKNEVSEMFAETFADSFGKLAAAGYGDILVVVKDRGQFQISGQEINPKYAENKLEQISSKVIDENHVGVRTGFASTEIDYIIVKDNILKDRRLLENLFFALAKQGDPIPVVNSEGKEIFTEEMYDTYRKAFIGIEKFDGGESVIETVAEGSYAAELIEELLPSIREDRQKVIDRNTEIRNKLKDVLSEMGINLKDEFDVGLLGADLQDIGSSGRGTNLPGDYDFDYTLLLDPNEHLRSQEINNTVLDKFKHEGTTPAGGNTRNIQIRMKGVELESGEKLDVDIGINAREDGQIYGSHNAVADRLDEIREVHGEEVRDEVVANILVAKKLLKEGHAYKKGKNGDYGDGGLGGIGVENWILQNNGSVENAFKTFWNTAHDENGEIIPFEDFQKKYPLYDAGTNLRGEKYHDNFVYILQNEGYLKMIKVIEDYRNHHTEKEEEEKAVLDLD
jgi:hypothetical protein